MKKKNKPKYRIGHRIPKTEFVVRGIAPQESGDYLYFVQVVGSDNCIVANLSNIEKAIFIVSRAFKEAARN